MTNENLSTNYLMRRIINEPEGIPPRISTETLTTEMGSSNFIQFEMKRKSMCTEEIPETGLNLTMKEDALDADNSPKRSRRENHVHIHTSEYENRESNSKVRNLHHDLNTLSERNSRENFLNNYPKIFSDSDFTNLTDTLRHNLASVMNDTLHQIISKIRDNLEDYREMDFAQLSTTRDANEMKRADILNLLPDAGEQPPSSTLHVNKDYVKDRADVFNHNEMFQRNFPPQTSLSAHGYPFMIFNSLNHTNYSNHFSPREMSSSSWSRPYFPEWNPSIIQQAPISQTQSILTHGNTFMNKIDLFSGAKLPKQNDILPNLTATSRRKRTKVTDTRVSNARSSSKPVGQDIIEESNKRSHLDQSCQKNIFDYHHSFDMTSYRRLSDEFLTIQSPCNTSLSETTPPCEVEDSEFRCNARDHTSLSDVNQSLTLTPVHLRKAKLMFFYTRYPSSPLLKTYFSDIKFNKNNTAQLVKWFSNFREFYYIQMEKYARNSINEGIQDCESIKLTTESDIYRILNMHYNRNNQIEVPEHFLTVVEITLKEFFKALYNSRDHEQSWKKPIYKIIARLDKPLPPYFKSLEWLEQSKDS